MNKDIRICFMGSPLFGAIVLEKLINEYNVVLVVTQPDSFSNGNRKVNVPKVKEVALKYNIPVFQSDNIKTNHEEMEKYDFDFLVTAAYGQFIPKSVLALPKIKVLNVHGSELPYYRGGAPIERAIEDGKEYLGVSIMKTVSKMDAGDVYKISYCKNEEFDTYGTLSLKLAEMGKEDVCEIIDKLYINHELKGVSQDESLVTFAPIIKKEECIIDFNMDAKMIVNKIKAFNPSPVAFFINKGVKYKVYMAKVIDDNSNNKPGTIIINNKELVIKCLHNSISILEIQKEGKNKMDIKSFLNGNKDIFNIGEIIE